MTKRRVGQFLQRELKMYVALLSFLAERGGADRVRLGSKEVLIGPAFYKERSKEARKLMNEFRNAV
jgi:hypothetical protein